MLEWLRSWRIRRDVVLLGLARMVDSFGASTIIILLPLYVEHFQVGLGSLSTPFVIGILLSIYGLVNSLSQPSVGVFMDRWGGRKGFLVSGLALYASTTLLFIWIQWFSGLFVLRIIQGIGVALTIPPSIALMTEYTEPEQRGTAMGLYNVMRLTGFSVGPLAAGYLIPRVGFAPVLMLAAAAGAVGVGLVWWLIEDPPRSPSRSRRERLSRTYGAFFSSDMTEFLKLAYANVAMATSISLIAALENEFNRRLDQTPTEFGVAFSALLLTMMVFQIPLGRLSDRIGRKTVILGGLILLIPVTLWLAYLTSTLQFVTARALQGVGVAAVAAPSLALGGDKSRDERRGRELSVISMAFGLGIGVGPLLSGFLAGEIGFVIPFWVSSVMTLLGVWTVAAGVSEKSLEKEAEAMIRQSPD